MNRVYKTQVLPTMAHTCHSKNLLSHGKTYFSTEKLAFPRQNFLFHGQTFFPTAKHTFPRKYLLFHGKTYFSTAKLSFHNGKTFFSPLDARFSISARCSSAWHPLSAMGKKSSSFPLQEQIGNLLALLETPEPPFNPDPQDTGAIPKKKPAKKTQSSTRTIPLLP